MAAYWACVCGYSLDNFLESAATLLRIQGGKQVALHAGDYAS